MKVRSALPTARAVCFAGAVLGPGSLAAQTPTAAEGPSGSPQGLQTIEISANKRLEDIQNVPLSVTAFTASELEAKGAQQFFDYGIAVPNLSFGLGAGDGTLAARGIALRGIQGGGMQGASTTGFYIDDTPVVETLDPHLIDVERVEVLRGPQGTLYGAESMGGTVRIITEQPETTTFSGQGHVSISDTEHGAWNQLAEGVVNMPLVSNALAIRASGFYQFDSGWFTKGVGPEAVSPASVFRDVGSMRFYGGQLALRYQPADGWIITPRIMYQQTDQNGALYAPYNPNDLLQREVFNLPEGGTDKWWLASLTLNYAVPSGSFVSSTSVFDRRTFETEDDTDVLTHDLALPGPEAIPGPVTRLLDLHRFAEEARFASAFRGPLQVIAGGFYARSTVSRNYEVTSTGLTAATGYPSDLVLSLINQHQYSQYAAFGDVSYDVVSNLTATVGVRWHRDTAAFDQFTNGLFYGGAPHHYAATPTGESGFTPRYVLEYRVTPDILTYASAAKGFREGGNNSVLPVGPPPQGCSEDLANIGLTPSGVLTFRSDSLWSYELGFKSSFLERRFTLNAAGFVIEWNNIQQQVSLPLCGYSFTGNSGKAQSSGFELEFNGKLSAGLIMGLGVGYEDARITQKGPGTPQPVGSSVYQVPGLNLSANATYERPLNRNWKGFARLDYSHTGESFSGNNTPLNPSRRPAYNITDLRLGVRHDRYEIVSFVKNLTNEHANLGDAVLLGAELPGQPRILINQPRTLGIEARMRF